jgi:hypothetical protein
MSQDEYGELLQAFLLKETDLGEKQQQLLQAKANVSGYLLAYVDSPYVSWEMAQVIARYERQVSQATTDFIRAKEDWLKLRSSLILCLPIKDIGVTIHLKYAPLGPATLPVKMLLKAGTTGESPEDFALFINEKEY